MTNHTHNQSDTPYQHSQS